MSVVDLGWVATVMSCRSWEIEICVGHTSNRARVQSKPDSQEQEGVYQKSDQIKSRILYIIRFFEWCTVYCVVKTLCKCEYLKDDLKIPGE